MTEPERFPADIYLAGVPEDLAAYERQAEWAAVQQARGYLYSWRNRFTAGGDGGRTAAEYASSAETVRLDSDSPEVVRVEHLEHNQATVYAFDAAAGQLNVSRAGGHPAAADIQAYQQFVRLLFDSDRREARGR